MDGTECCGALTSVITHQPRTCAACGLQVTITGKALHEAAVLRSAASILQRRAKRRTFTLDVIIRVLRNAARKIGDTNRADRRRVVTGHGSPPFVGDIVSGEPGDDLLPGKLTTWPRWRVTAVAMTSPGVWVYDLELADK